MSVNQLNQYLHPDGYLINGGGSPCEDIGAVADKITGMAEDIDALSNAITGRLKHVAVDYADCSLNTETVPFASNGHPWMGYVINDLRDYMRNVLKINPYTFNAISWALQGRPVWAYAIVPNGVGNHTFPYDDTGNWISTTGNYKGSIQKLSSNGYLNNWMILYDAMEDTPPDTYHFIGVALD